MLLGSAARAAAAEGAALRPLFSHYAPHGPVFRVAAVVDRSAAPGDVAEARRLGGAMLGVCGTCGEAAFSYNDAGDAGSDGDGIDASPPERGDDPGRIRAAAARIRRLLRRRRSNESARCRACGEPFGADAVAGPLWAGPLHSAATAAAMRADAESRGWLGDRGHARRLTRLLDALVAESEDAALDATLFKSLDDVARRAGVRTPGRGELAAELKKRGWSAAPTHVEGKAVKTGAPFSVVVAAARAVDAASKRPG